MAIGSGLGAYVGLKAETVFGTYVAPDRFHEPSGEVSWGKVKNVYQGGGVASGRMVQPGTRRVVVTKGAGGSLPMEVANTKMGVILQHIFGSTPTPTVQNTSTGYLQAHTLADNYGKSLCGQVGIPDRAGTVRPYSFLGGKITSAEFSCTVNEPLTVTLEMDYRDVTEAQAAVTPSYTTGQIPFHWGHLTAKLGTFGSEASVSGVRGFTFRVERPMDLEGFYAGNAGLKDQPVMNDFVVVSGSVDVDYVTKADFADRFASDTATSMRMRFEDTATSLGGTPTIYPLFELGASQVFFDEGTPKVSGPGIITTSYSFKGQNDLTNAAAFCNYISTDSAL